MGMRDTKYAIHNLPHLPDNEFRVLTAILDHRNEGVRDMGMGRSDAWPSQETLSRLTGKSTRQISRLTKKLQARGLILIKTKPTKSGGRQNSYQITYDGGHLFMKVPHCGDGKKPLDPKVTLLPPKRWAEMWDSEDRTSGVKNNTENQTSGVVGPDTAMADEYIKGTDNYIEQVKSAPSGNANTSGKKYPFSQGEEKKEAPDSEQPNMELLKVFADVPPSGYCN